MLYVDEQEWQDIITNSSSDPVAGERIIGLAISSSGV
jgi:hypothetical protein